MGFLVSVFFGFFPMLLFALFIYWLDRYEKEPGALLGVAFTWGAVIAASAAFLINTIFGTSVYVFTRSEILASFTTSTFVAPVVEESLKSLAVLLVFYLVRSEFDSILDGIVYAAITALGFAATENAYYIYSYGFLENGWLGVVAMVVIRVILVGWQHPFYTSFFGIGLAFSRLNRSAVIRWGAPAAGWLAAVILHSIHNTISTFFTGGMGIFLTTSFDWLGWLSMFIFILWMTSRERKILARCLQDELQQGLITSHQYHTACSAWSQTAHRINAFFKGHLRETNRFYQLCAELAHKKNQLALIGEETGNSRYIKDIKAELTALSASLPG